MTVYRQKRVLNFIAVIGFVLSLLSILLYPFFIVQIAALVFCVIGYLDAKKCGNRGVGLAVTGMIISACLLIAAAFTWIYLAYHIMHGLPAVEAENMNLILRIVYRILVLFL